MEYGMAHPANLVLKRAVMLTMVLMKNNLVKNVVGIEDILMVVDIHHYIARVVGDLLRNEFKIYVKNFQKYQGR